MYEGGSLFGPMGLVFRSQLARPLIRDNVVLLSARQSRANLAALRGLAEAGDLTPVVDRTYPLAEAAEALRYLEGGARPRQGRAHRPCGTLTKSGTTRRPRLPAGGGPL